MSSSRLPVIHQSLLTATATVILASSCAQQQSAQRAPSTIPAFYVDADGTHQSLERDTLHNMWPHLMYGDSALSINDRCPVRKALLNRRLPALLVNGRPLGFC